MLDRRRLDQRAYGVGKALEALGAGPAHPGDGGGHQPDAEQIGHRLGQPILRPVRRSAGRTAPVPSRPREIEPVSGVRSDRSGTCAPGVQSGAAVRAGRTPGGRCNRSTAPPSAPIRSRHRCRGRGRPCGPARPPDAASRPCALSAHPAACPTPRADCASASPAWACSAHRWTAACHCSNCSTHRRSSSTTRTINTLTVSRSAAVSARSRAFSSANVARSVAALASRSVGVSSAGGMDRLTHMPSPASTGFFHRPTWAVTKKSSEPQQ
jgi:hypothetical protein